MILIEITYDATIAEDWLKETFIPAIRNAASQCMKELFAETRVSVRKGSDLDVRLDRLAIVILSDRNPDRSEIANAHCLQIRDRLKPILTQNLRVSLWIQLTRGACVEFVGDLDGCMIAKRLFATLGHGNDLAPGSQEFLRDHTGVCPACRSEWESVRVLMRSE